MELFHVFLKVLPYICCLCARTVSLCVENGNCDVRHARKSDKLAFYSVKTAVYQQCCNLCASMSKCTSVNYDVRTRQCDLLSDWTNEKALAHSKSSVYGTFTVKKGNQPKNICRTRPCQEHQVCVMTSSCESYVCLGVCTSPPRIDRMTAGLDSITLTTGQAKYKCDTGYLPDSGSGLSDCSITSGWTPPSLICTVIDCGSPPNHTNLIVASVNSTLYKNLVTYTCAVGYFRTEGDHTAVCQEDGTWSTPTLKCEVIHCGSATDRIDMEQEMVTSTEYGSFLTFICSPGFESSGGDGTSVCQADGTWSTPTLMCTRKNCLTPPSIENMTFTVTSTLYENEAVYACDLGYNATNGSGKIVCQADASWEIPTLRCEIVECGQPPNVTNMTLLSYSTTSYNSTALYTCALGYIQNGGDGASVCQSNGTWSQPSLECPIVDCGKPPEFGSYELANVESTVYGSVAVYRCLLRYTSPENALSVCQHTGKWSTFSLVCRGIQGIISSGKSTSSNTSLDCVTRLSKEGLSVSVPCESDEVLTGCSSFTVDNTTKARGQLIAYNSCYSYGSAAVRAVGRCCKQNGLQCEHIRKITETSCVKDFQLLDCSCAAAINNRHCSTDHVNQSCVPVTVDAPNNHNSYYLSLCCTSPKLSCHTKVLDSEDLTIQCDTGEVMTGCSGYNTDTNIQGAVIQEVGGVETCVISPGTSNITTLTGYAHCCTSL